jgi:heme exporter protein A
MDVMTVELTLANLTKRYSGRKILNNLELTVVGGEVIGIFGPNGSGKSTLLRCIAGLLRPSAGSVKLHINECDYSAPALLRSMVGYVSPELNLYPELSARENLQFFAAVTSRPSKPIAELLSDVGLAKRLDDPIGTYSSGMRQRVRLALAALHEPPILLLDEPGLALDEGGQDVVIAMIEHQRQRGGIVILATNDQRERELVQRHIHVG